MDPNHPDKAQLLRAAALTRSLLGFASLQLALADFHTARREVGPYSAFYAYRVLEDVGFQFGATKDDKPDWQAMNRALGTNKTKWDPLTDAGTWARHLNRQKMSKLAGITREDLLGLAHEAVTLALTRVGVDSRK